MSTPVFDYYKALGLSKDASFEDGALPSVLSLFTHFERSAVRRAYKQKVLETHPDKLPPDSTEWEKEAAREQFSRVSCPWIPIPSLS
jgi:curved DNA-binding protein CbpA